MEIELITKRFLLKEVNPDYAKTIAKEYGKDEGELQFVVKGFEPSDMEFSDGESSSIDYITTKSIDRDGEIVEPSGVLLDVFKKHPVVVWCHDYKQLPLGKSAWVKSNEKGLISKTIYAVKANPFAKQVYEYRRDGFPLGKSMGFVPLEWEDFNPKVTKGLKRKYNKVVLLEYSDVPIPSNAGALQIAVSKGLLRSGEIEKMFYFSDIEKKELLIEFEEDIEMNKKSSVEYCEVCKSDQEFVLTSDDAEGVLKCSTCGTIKKPKKKEIEYEDVETKAAKKVVCPECGAEATPVEGKENVACPECGAMIELKSGKAEGPGGHVPDGTGPHGRGNGPGEGKADGTGKKKKEEEKEEEENKKKTKDIDAEKIEKKRYLDGTPSVSDIIEAITSKASIFMGLVAIDNVGGEMPVSTNINPYLYVRDLYPVNFPDGKAVVVYYGKSTKENLFTIDYLYNGGDAIISNPVEVKDMYAIKSISDSLPEVVNKEIEEKLKEFEEDNEYLVEKVKVYAIEIDRLKEFEEELITIKEGRVLSGKNRKMIQDCIDQMGSSIEALRDLMNATDISGKEIEDENIETKEVGDFFEFTDDEEESEDILTEITKEDIEDITKRTIEACGVGKKTIDIGAIINKVEAKMKGKVL